MTEEYYSSAARPRSGGILKAVLGTALLAFLAGAALVGWLIWDGRVTLPGKPDPQLTAGNFAQPSPSPSATAAPVSGALLEQQVAALEQRLARIDLQAAAAEGNTARAEALLVALAARRAIDRGIPLGYLEDQLRLRFGAARPAAVNTVIAAARDPITLDRLAAELDALAPQLTGEDTEETAWAKFRRQLSGLFVVHSDAPGTSAPAARLDRARLLLRTGQVDAARAEVARLPGSKAATGWLERAQRYVETQSALDQIEQAALAEPQRLKAGTGEEVRQPGPGVLPAPGATPAPTPAPTATTAAREATF
ncbi:MAG: hypothetical protein J0L50_14240 [Sphingomonadales bacterium]|nr:hypothetical protein [Sphingomonadales bacterium]